jgi:hypothetical protein
LGPLGEPPLPFIHERCCRTNGVAVISAPSLQHGENEITGGFFLKVVHRVFRSPGFKSLFLKLIEFLGLSRIRAETR